MFCSKCGSEIVDGKCPKCGDTKRIDNYTIEGAIVGFLCGFTGCYYLVKPVGNEIVMWVLFPSVITAILGTIVGMNIKKD